MKSMPHRPLYCILPPHILRSIAANGTQAQRSAAVRSLSVDHTIRLSRATHQLLQAGVRRATVAAAPVGKRRTIYTASNEEALPGAVTRLEGAPATGDLAADEAYDGLGSTFDFYWDVFDRNSIDDEGLPLDATVHYGSAYDNAFWNGQQMVFGDGDQDVFNRFTISLDVIGHELTHGVTGDEVNLVYTGESGALNESVSDVFGSLVKQYALKQTATDADWLIGAGLFTDKVHGVALRSMKAPGTAYDDPLLGKDPQPANMSGYVHTTEDNGGVHINSGIPNHAFFIVASQFGSYAWEKAGRIWYETLRDPRLRPTASFRQFAGRTVRQASQLFGPAEAQAVLQAWREVGVKVS